MSNPLFSEIEQIAQKARTASLGLCNASTAQKNQALQAIARGIESNRKLLKEENEKDLAMAEENGLSEAMCPSMSCSIARTSALSSACVLPALDDVISPSVRNRIALWQLDVNSIPTESSSRSNATVIASIVLLLPMFLQSLMMGGNGQLG